MYIGYKTNSEVGSVYNESINLTPGGSLWGSMVLGSDLWGGGTNQDKKRVFLGSAKGERIQFYFSNQNTVSQRFKVHWINYAYNVKGER